MRKRLIVTAIIVALLVSAFYVYSVQSDAPDAGCHQFFEVGEDVDGDGIPDSAVFFEWCNMVFLPIVANNNGLPTPAPTMPVYTPMPYPTPAPTPTEVP